MHIPCTQRGGRASLARQFLMRKILRACTVSPPSRRKNGGLTVVDGTVIRQQRANGRVRLLRLGACQLFEARDCKCNAQPANEEPPPPAPRVPVPHVHP